jgi:glycosyltransferase involved in cell wall biosynthesis
MKSAKVKQGKRNTAPIRILQVMSYMGRAGAETMIMNYYRNIDRNKVQFDFVVHTEEHCAYDDEIKELGGKLFRMPRYRVLNHFAYLKAWQDLLKSHPEHRVLHGHYFTFSALYFWVARKYKVKCIGHSHIEMKKNFKSRIMRVITFPLRYLSDYFFACSIAAGEFLFGLKVIHGKRFTVLNNAIDANLFAYNKNKRVKARLAERIDDKFVIGHIGRFATQKNHEFLIDIFSEIKKVYSASVLLLVGDGGLRNVIEKKVADLGLNDDVIFTGVREDIPDLLQAMDVFLFPSLFEGLGIVAVEAQAAGLHCIVSDTVPSEAKLTDLVEFVSLKESPKYWASKVLQYAGGYARRNTFREIVDAGYDIKDSAIWLEKFYLDRHREATVKRT